MNFRAGAGRMNAAAHGEVFVQSFNSAGQQRSSTGNARPSTASGIVSSSNSTNRNSRRKNQLQNQQQQQSVSIQSDAGAM